MEKKSRCDSLCEMILEDKSNIIQNLERLIHKINFIAEIANTSQNNAPKDIRKCNASLIDVLKQTSNINAVLESIIEELQITHTNEESIDVCRTELQEEPVDDHAIHLPSMDNNHSLSVPNMDMIDMLDTSKNSTHESCVISGQSSLINQICDPVEVTNMEGYGEQPEPLRLEDSHSGTYYSADFEVPEKDAPTISKKEDQILEKLVEDLPPDLEDCSSSSSYQSLGHFNHLSDSLSVEKFNNHQSDGNKNVISVPDIKVKPIETTIKNDIVLQNTQKKASTSKKKKKNRKRVNYEIPSNRSPDVDEECTICHIVSPNEFYIHLNDDETCFVDEISNVLGKHITKNKRIKYNSKAEALDDFGKFGFVFLESNMLWYRIEILDELKDNNNDILVQLVDFGNTKTVPYTNLQRITKELSDIDILHFPKLAVRCQLPMFFPPESTRLHRLSEWPQDTIEIMHELCRFDEEFSPQSFFKLVYVVQEGKHHVVDLHRVDLENTSTLGQILLEVGAAVQIIDSCDPNNMELERFVDDIDDIEKYNINEAITAYDPRDEARICKFSRNDGTCFKKHCKLEHTSLRKDGFTTDKEIVFTRAIYPLILPRKNSITNILITGNISVCRFFAQIISNPVNTGKYLMDFQLDTLNQEMNANEMVKKYESFKIDPALGEVVLVEHWNSWSRAIVREFVISSDDSDPCVQVYMVDYGEYQIKFIKHLRKIEPQFLVLPFQAVECYLQNYELNPECNPTEAQKFFDTNMYLRNFVAITKSEDQPLKVVLKNENETMDVGQTLEIYGYAQRTTTDINVSDDSYIQLS